MLGLLPIPEFYYLVSRFLLQDILTPVKDPHTKKIVSPRSKVLHLCQQDELISFEDYIMEG
jgi:hypothetical protein